MGKIIKLSSGAELDMTMSSFDDGEILLQAVLKEIDAIQITEKTDHIAIFKSIFARTILSKEIKSALKPCLERVTYNKVRLTNDIFEDEKVRCDYLPVLKEVLEYNLTPFFVNLISGLQDLESKLRALQKPK